VLKSAVSAEDGRSSIHAGVPLGVHRHLLRPTEILVPVALVLEGVVPAELELPGRLVRVRVSARHERPRQSSPTRTPDGTEEGSGIRVLEWFRATAPGGACPSLGSRFVVKRRRSLERELASGGPWRSAAWLPMKACGGRRTLVETDEDRGHCGAENVAAAQQVVEADKAHSRCAPSGPCSLTSVVRLTRRHLSDIVELDGPAEFEVTAGRIGQ
jgi:hypothetical protein